MLTPIHVIEANFAHVPRVYIESDRDNAIPPRLQKPMIAALQ